MNSLEIRKKFFDFFEKRQHTKVPSSSLIPAQDPTILFTNAGMNQFKDLFLGKETRSYTRAVSIQKCMRAGGKHNDLDNVGFTKRHLTFFEMMGNFSFGDYFKKDAIKFAWDFLIKEMGFNPETLHATVYKKDDEAYDIWHKEIGLPESQVHRLGEADNFWQMGDTGPCGPCSELLVDRGADRGCGKKTCAPGCSCDRFLEVWNLVFMQFDRQPNGQDNPLKRVGVDTGMGLERLCVIVQDKDSVFETDLFAPIIAGIEKLTGLVYKNQSPALKAAFHVLADHIRASSFLIADGCSPSNEGRGYVLRKIIRRAALFSKKLTEKQIFPELANVVIDHMSSIYPELKENRQAIISLLKSEVEKFATNLVHGQHILEEYFAKDKNKIVSGEQAFKLYDTYGFPLELTQLIAQEKGFAVDVQSFNEHMEKQREQSGKKVVHEEKEITLPVSVKTTFTGYQELDTVSPITAIIHENKLVNSVGARKKCWIITQTSPFYVECGGQVSDQGKVIFGNEYSVSIDGLKKIDGAIAIELETPIAISVGDSVKQVVNKEVRLDTMKNHTATHLLQAALIELLGKQVKQAGSLVVPDYLRFDFTYHENLTPEQIKRVEDVVNKKIQENIPVSTKETTYKDAVNAGVIAFFGEKYNPDKVRVVTVPGFSAELCGGTHVRATGDIGCFKITEVTALSAGQRRLVAVTGPKAVELFQQSFSIVKNLAQEYKVRADELLTTLAKQREHLKHAQSQIKKLKSAAIKGEVPSLLEKITLVGKIPFLYVSMPELSNEEMKDLATLLQQKKPGFYFLLTGDAHRSSLYAALSPEYETHFSLKDLSAWLEQKGLRCGGKGLTLQGGGPLVGLDFEDSLKKWVMQHQK